MSLGKWSRYARQLLLCCSSAVPRLFIPACMPDSRHGQGRLQPGSSKLYLAAVTRHHVKPVQSGSCIPGQLRVSLLLPSVRLNTTQTCPKFHIVVALSSLKSLNPKHQELFRDRLSGLLLLHVWVATPLPWGRRHPLALALRRGPVDLPAKR